MPSSVGVVVLLLLAFAGPAAISGSTGHGPAVAGSHSSGLHPATCSYASVNAVIANGDAPDLPSFTTTSGDPIVVLVASYSFSGPAPTTGLLSDGVDTFTLAAYVDFTTGTHNGNASLWTATAAASGAQTLTLTNGGSWETMSAYDLSATVGDTLTFGTLTADPGTGSIAISASNGPCANLLALSSEGYNSPRYTTFLSPPSGWTVDATGSFGGGSVAAASDSNTAATTGTASATLTGGSGYGVAVMVVYGQAAPPPPAPPAAPTGLVVTPVSPTQIDLVWDNPVGPLTDNHAYEYAGWACSGSATAYDFMAVVSSSNFPGLTPSTVYSYTVTASNSTGESAPSACLATTTFGLGLPPPAPTHLAASTVGPYQINLSWANPPAVPSVITSVGVGAFPDWAAYDAGTHEVFVPNANGNSVSVISDATDTIAATISLGAGASPSGIAYDPAKGELFVATHQGLKVISDGTDVVVGTIGLGLDPYGVVYDSGTGKIFVANAGDDNVSVISDVTDTVVTSVTVGAFPFGVEYDPGMHQIFVVNEGDGTVSVISDAMDTVVATVPVGASPYDAAYDAATGQVFVTNYADGTVSVISDSTDTIVATVTGLDTPYVIVYNAYLGEIFIGDQGTNTISVINDTTDSVVATVVVGTSPYGIAYDAGTYQIFVANSVSDNVSVMALLPQTDNHVYVYSGPSCTGTPAAVDLGLVGTAYPDAGLSGGTAYSYTVTASNSAGEGPTSGCAANTTFGVAPSLTVSNVSFYTFNETWSNGTWSNVTGAYLVLTFNASICGSVVWGDTTNSYWTWAVYTGGGVEC